MLQGFLLTLNSNRMTIYASIEAWAIANGEDPSGINPNPSPKVNFPSAGSDDGVFLCLNEYNGYEPCKKLCTHCEKPHPKEYFENLKNK